VLVDVDLGAGVLGEIHACRQAGPDIEVPQGAIYYSMDELKKVSFQLFIWSKGVNNFCHAESPSQRQAAQGRSSWFECGAS